MSLPQTEWTGFDFAINIPPTLSPTLTALFGSLLALSKDVRIVLKWMASGMHIHHHHWFPMRLLLLALVEQHQPLKQHTLDTQRMTAVPAINHSAIASESTDII